MTAKNLAIFASGSGSNAAAIIDYFESKDHIHVRLIVCNNPKAGVLTRPQTKGIEKIIISGDELRRCNALIEKLKDHRIDLIVLAGFLLLLPPKLIDAFPLRIINIHPALLPNYGGKGMYGQHVHKAVYDNNEEESGITIHLVNEQYDKGRILFQATCHVGDAQSPEDVGRKVLKLEHQYYAQVIEDYVGQLYICG